VPIVLAEPPPATLHVLETALADLAGTPRVLPHGVRRAGTPSLTAALPHAVHAVDPLALVRGDGLEGARLVAWRWLLVRGGTVVGAADVACDPDGARPRFGAVAEGPIARGTWTTLRRAERLPAVAEGRWSLRAVSCAGLGEAALWLTGAGRASLVLPVWTMWAPQRGARGPACVTPRAWGAALAARIERRLAVALPPP
jgi:hypothetical protein